MTKVVICAPSTRFCMLGPINVSSAVAQNRTISLLRDSNSLLGTKLFLGTPHREFGRKSPDRRQ